MSFSEKELKIIKYSHQFVLIVAYFVILICAIKFFLVSDYVWGFTAMASLIWTLNDSRDKWWMKGDK